jgi:RHS repeat-associated protein
VQRYWYDANGNVTRRITPWGTDITLSYDAENRLTGVSGSATASYVYDGDGNRVKATVNGVTSVYVGNYYEVTGGVVKKYYYHGSTRVAESSGGTLYWLLTDHLGGTNVTLTASGTYSTELRYYPYGYARYNAGNQATTYRYTGQRWDPGTGLYFYGARWYDPVIGRFIQADTIVPEPGNPQALNRFSYAANNPLRYVDPSGYAECGPNDQQCWINEWNWKNRWYNAHGYFWGGSHWSVAGDPVFADEGITDEVIAEAGITLQSNVTPWPWSWANKQKVAYGVAKFGQKLARGIAGLKALLGGYAVINLNPAIPFYCTGACAPPPPWTGGHDVFFAIASFSAVDLLGGAQWVVHELAHVIDWQGNFSQRWEPYAALTNYAANARSVPPFYYSSWEKWAEAVAVWVFGNYDATAGRFVTSYRWGEVKKVKIEELTTQMDRLHALLNGWY